MANTVWTQRLTHAWLRRSPLAWALLPLAALYGGIVALRSGLFKYGLKRSRRLPVPVIVVGNRVAGGAGKTPTTIAIVQHLLSRGLKVGVISRGHGRATQTVQSVDAGSTPASVGDEPLLIWHRCGVPVFVGRDRFAAGRALLSAYPATEVLITDDGLQHLQLARNVEVVVFDERGAGNGWPIPAGPLRDPIRANPLGCQQIVLYSAGQPSTQLPGFIAQRQLGGFAKLADWHSGQPAQTRPTELFAVPAQEMVAAAGIAVPQRFFDQLAAKGLRFSPLPLPDHHPYATRPWPDTTRVVVVTEKDAVKLASQPHTAQAANTCSIWVAQLDFQPEPAFFRALDDALHQPSHITRHGRTPA